MFTRGYQIFQHFRNAPRVSDAQKAFVVVNHIDKGDKAPSSVLVLATVSAAKVAMVSGHSAGFQKNEWCNYSLVMTVS
jgi:hypothetical protein